MARLPKKTIQNKEGHVHVKSFNWENPATNRVQGRRLGGEGGMGIKHYRRATKIAG